MPKLRDILTTTTEKVSHLVFDVNTLGRYCQCMRFVRAWQFSKVVQSPMLIFDIDMAVTADLMPSVANLRSADVGLIRNSQNFDPGLKVSAGSVYLAPNQAAQNFLRRASAQMLLHALHGRFTEKLDQRCLSIGADGKSDGLQVIALPFGLVGKGDNPVIFTGRGKLKHTSLPQKFQSLGLK